MIKILLITAGFISFTLGVIGIVLPLLPTTPFLLLAAACFFRSSDRLYRWITNHPVFGCYIESFRRYRAVSLKAKFISVITLWIFISFSAFFVVPHVWIKIMLFLIASGVTIYILNLRTLTAEMKDHLKER